MKIHAVLVFLQSTNKNLVNLMNRFLLLLTIILMYSFPAAAVSEKTLMEHRLSEYVSGKDATIGIAVIINGNDTVAVNGDKDFPMLSVYKFPQALAVADYCKRHDIGLGDTVAVKATELKIDTWSPLRDKYGISDLTVTVNELLEYTLQLSDNNACDILFRLIGGTQAADSLMKSMGYNDIHIISTEDEMHKDPSLCYLNSSTPIAMARLFDRFYREIERNGLNTHRVIGEIMTSCTTGANRLPAPLKSSDAIIGHKTGTGDTNSLGRIIGINDAGIVYLPDGNTYSIAVFIKDSAYDMAETEKMIAEISELVYKSLPE